MILGKAHITITIKRSAESKLVCERTDMWFGCAGQRGGNIYEGKTVESVTSRSTVCCTMFSTVAPSFDPSRSIIQTC